MTVNCIHKNIYLSRIILENSIKFSDQSFRSDAQFRNNIYSKEVSLFYFHQFSYKRRISKIAIRTTEIVSSKLD